MLRVFVGKAIRDSLTQTERDGLVADFKRYKSTGELPDTFGRDVPYDHAHTLPAVRAEELMHLHLAENEPWPLSTVQFYRTSDKHLVYCQGYTDHNCYALMAFLEPEAHSKAWDRDLMLRLAASAQAFRNSH